MELRVDLHGRITLEPLDDELTDPRSCWNELHIERTVVENFEGDRAAKAVLDRWCREVHHEAESSEGTSPLHAGSESRTGGEVYSLSRDGEQKTRLFVVGRENAAAIGVHGRRHDECVRSLNVLLIGKVQLYMNTVHVETTLVPDLKHAAKSEVYGGRRVLVIRRRRVDL